MASWRMVGLSGNWLKQRFGKLSDIRPRSLLVKMPPRFWSASRAKRRYRFVRAGVAASKIGENRGVTRRINCSFLPVLFGTGFLGQAVCATAPAALRISAETAPAGGAGYH